MKKNFLNVIALLMVIVFSLTLFGCDQKATEVKEEPKKEAKKEEPVTITWVNWVSTEEGTRDKIKSVVDQFEKDNPNIKVDIKPVPVSDIQNQLTIMVTGKNAPDISQVHPDDVIALAAMGALEPVDELLSADFKADLHQSLLDLTTFEGTRYGIPWAPAGPGFLYNKKLMEQAGLDPKNPPNTIYEFTEALEIAKKNLPKDVIGFQLDTTIRTIGLQHEWPFMRAFGALPIDGNNIDIDTPEMKEYAEWLRTVVKNGYTLPGKKYGEFRPMAAQGRLLFAFDGSYLRGIVTSLNTEITDQIFNETWGVASLPGTKDGKHYASPDDHFLVAFKDSENKEAVAKFAEYLVNSDYSLKNYINPVGFVPATKSAIQRVPEISQDPIRSAFIEKIVPTVVPLPYGPNYSSVATAFMAGMQEVITTDKPIDEILSKLQTKVEEASK
ncbi:MAG: hypothetical protein JM58_10220 [Peptococcaceae bacterium BICA1-8]|nr:MAG: hypothetical protein JM58_10220 [Peptococcaceae bacterium BICA1-8]